MSFDMLIALCFISLLIIPVSYGYPRNNVVKLYSRKMPSNSLMLIILSSSKTIVAASDMNWDPYAAPKLNFKECYYKILEVSLNSTQETIKKSFYKLVLQYHPDGKETQYEKDLCNKQMMVINGAYRTLKDPNTRYVYDCKMQYRKIKDIVQEEQSATCSIRRRNNHSKSKSTISEDVYTRIQSRSVQDEIYDNENEFYESIFTQNEIDKAKAIPIKSHSKPDKKKHKIAVPKKVKGAVGGSNWKKTYQARQVRSLGSGFCELCGKHHRGKCMSTYDEYLI